MAVLLFYTKLYKQVLSVPFSGEFLGLASKSQPLQREKMVALQFFTPIYHLDFSKVFFTKLGL